MHRRYSILLTLLLSSCANIPNDAGFNEIQTDIASRINQHPQWNRGTAADEQVAAAIKSLLANDVSPEDAVQIALLNNQSLQATYEDLGIAQAELVEAGLLHNPTLNAEVRFPSHARLPFEIDISQSFLDLLLLPVHKKLAGASFEAARLRVTHQILTTAADVRAAYYRAQGAAQLVEMRQTILKATDASYSAAKRLREAGNITELALANEQALHEQSKVDLAKSEQEALDAREELTALMGLWGENINWKIPPRLAELPPVDLAETHLESLAVSHRPDLLAAQQSVEIASQSLGLTRNTAWFNDLALGAHFEQDADGTTTVGPTVQIPLPLFNQGQPAIAAAQSRLRQSERRYAALAVEIRSQVRRARNRMSAARALAEYQSRIILPLRHKIVEETQLQYNAMLAGVFQLLEARKAEIDAGREYVQALQDYWLARTELERAIGQSLPLQSSPPTSRPSPLTPPATMPASHHHHQESP